MAFGYTGSRLTRTATATNPIKSKFELAGFQTGEALKETRTLKESYEEGAQKIRDAAVAGDEDEDPEEGPATCRGTRSSGTPIGLV